MKRFWINGYSVELCRSIGRRLCAGSALRLVIDQTCARLPNAHPWQFASKASRLPEAVENFRRQELEACVMCTHELQLFSRMPKRKGRMILAAHRASQPLLRWARSSSLLTNSSNFTWANLLPGRGGHPRPERDFGQLWQRTQRQA